MTRSFVLKTSVLRRALQKKGMTMKDLAEVTMLDKATVSRLVSGETKRPKYEAAVAISKALGVSLKDLGYPFPTGAKW